MRRYQFGGTESQGTRYLSATEFVKLNDYGTLRVDTEDLGAQEDCSLSGI